ncbi:hypothetical protein QMN21_32765, partial [Serratia sp. Se-PFBMAAmG]|nr:hypothetical protein [Serratia sp. Se-PFBMAAmG]
EFVLFTQAVSRLLFAGVGGDKSNEPHFSSFRFTALNGRTGNPFPIQSYSFLSSKFCTLR